MKRKLRTAGPALVLVSALASVLAATPATAGQNCEARPPSVVTVERAMDLAQRTARALEDSGARVVLLARSGQDLGRWGLRWSHLGFAYREDRGERGERGGGAVWRVLHKLNACGTASGALYRQGLGEFFLDDLFEYTAAWVVPTPELQRQLLPLLQDNARAAQLHQAAYSMVAYPWAQTYQQSNQWALETLALAAEPGIQRRVQAQAWLRFKDYRPSTLRIDALTRLGARVGQAHIAFDDHPSTERYADRIATVSVDSVFAWLTRSGLGGGVQTLR